MARPGTWEWAYDEGFFDGKYGQTIGSENVGAYIDSRDLTAAETEELMTAYVKGHGTW